MNRRPCHLGLLLAILACLGIVAAVELARHQREEAARERARREWAPLLQRARPR